MKGPVDWKNLFGGSRRKIAKKLAKKKRKADEGGWGVITPWVNLSVTGIC
jgi:hypothetical protein